jgi:hypothetical protein
MIKNYFFCFAKLNGSVLLLIFVLVSCSGIKIDSNQTKGDAGLIKQLANEELLKKGFVLDTLQPDAIFVFNSRVEEQISYSHGNVNTGYGYDGYGYYGGGYYSPVGVGRSSHHEYEEGMIYIDMLDTKTRVPLWGGWAKKKLTANSDVKKDIQSAVKLIFNRLKVEHK